jgi:hypothetical protein
MKTPFAPAEFFEVFVDYNTSVYPAQLLIILSGLIAVGLIHARLPLKDRLIGGFLGLIWIWAGLAYHITFFSAINKSALAFGVLFFLQGLFFIYEGFMRKRFSIEFSGKPMAYTGYFFIIFGLFAAINFGVHQDYMMIVAALTADAFLIARK